MATLSVLTTSVAVAQAGVTPGDISRQVEPARPIVLPQLQLQPPRITQPSQPKPGAQVTRIQAWVLQGAQMLDETTLQALLRPFTDVDLSLQQLREAAAVVQQAYDDAGWLARVDLPQQDITNGRVTLQITESRMGRIVVDPNATSLVKLERVKRILDVHQPQGQSVYKPQLDRALLLADDMSGINVVGSLQPGVQAGTTDLALNSTAQQPYSLDLSMDNTNARTVGAEKLTVVGSWVSPAGFGEVYTAQAFVTEGSDYLRVGASAPVFGVLGSRGLKASVYLSHMNYEIITPDINGKKQDIGGASQTAGADLIYPLIRSRQSNLYLTSGVDERRYSSKGDARYGVRGGQLGFSGNVFDDFAGAAATTYGLTWRYGRVGPSQPPAAKDVAVQGRYTKFNWNLARQQALSSSLSLYSAIQGQNTGQKTLDTSENMSLGGISGVRAYPLGEASGPQGHVVNVELRWRVSPQWLITPFYDQGRIEKRKTDTNTAYGLKGAGVSAVWTAPAGWTARVTYARRLGNNPNANLDTGKDNDGSLTRDRVWLSVSRAL